MKSIKLLFLTAILGSVILGACAPADTSANSAEILTEAAQIAFQALTETAAAASPTPTETQTAMPTATVPSSTPTPEGTLPTATATQQAASGGGTGGNPNAPCLRASFEIETIPDGTRFMVGTSFTKTWRLKNTGSCTWTPGYAVIWVQGDIMSADSTAPLTTTDIFPGDYVWISINMKAPNPAGNYKGYWMLRSDKGIIFGVGANSKEWFWVAIESYPDPDE